MMYFSAHYSDREPDYFAADNWPEAADIGAMKGTMITLYWLADDEGPAPLVEASENLLAPEPVT